MTYQAFKKKTDLLPGVDKAPILHQSIHPAKPSTDLRQIATEQVKTDLSTTGAMPSQTVYRSLTPDQQKAVRDTYKQNEPLAKSNLKATGYVSDIQKGNLPAVDALDKLTPQHRDMVQKALVAGGYALPSDAFTASAKPEGVEWSDYLNGVKNNTMSNIGKSVSGLKALFSDRAALDEYKQKNPHFWPSLVAAVGNADPSGLKALQEMTSGNADVSKLLTPDESKQLTSAAKSASWNAIKSDWFTNLPKVASLFLRQIGLGGIAGFAENPLVFYGGILTLLLGGSMLLSGGDDDEHEAQKPQYTMSPYNHPGYNRVPYT